MTACCATVHAAERITLRNGFSLSCDHRLPLNAEHVRLYFDEASTSYLDVAVVNILEAVVEPLAPLPPQLAPASVLKPAVEDHSMQRPALDTLIRAAGEERRLNVDLLRSIVNAESGGHTSAFSRAGAQGLMQLMPTTARSLGVMDSFIPEQNLRGGTDYLDTLLRHYRDNLVLALAAYNAGPAAVDRYHGVPPYPETQRYVARIIREFNRRTLVAQRNLNADREPAEIR